MSKNKPFWTKRDTFFLMYFGAIFLGTFLILYFFGLVPKEISDRDSVLDDLKLNAIELASHNEPENPVQKPEEVIKGEEPVYISIPHTEVSIIVQNPTSKDNAVLNEYLTRGVIRYPDSPLLGVGNVLIFGHSSNWKVVQNKAYKALNGIETLKQGDSIYVDSATSRYVYSVTKVMLVNASEEFVDFTKKDNMLTLSTCNTFGEKQERYVVEAKFVEKVAL